MASVGWREERVAHELPHLRLLSVETKISASPVAPSPTNVRDRLAALSDRFNGRRAIALRGEDVPSAYRVFFREIGLDPDVARTPIEEAVFMRMFDGCFLSSNLLEDVLLIALVDTGVAVWALDAETVDGPLGLRTSVAGERLGRPEPPQRGAARGAERGLQHGGGAPWPDAGGALPAGQLVVADGSAALAVLCGSPACGARPRKTTRRLLLYALEVDGVSSIAVEEALWIATSALQAQR